MPTTRGNLIGLLLPGMKYVANKNGGFVFVFNGKIYGVPASACREIEIVDIEKMVDDSEYEKIKEIVKAAVS